MLRDRSARRLCHLVNTDFFGRCLMWNQLMAYRSVGYEVTLVCGPGPFVREMREAGLRVIELSNTRELTPVADARLMLELIRLFRRERFDIVHTHNPKLNVFGVMAARWCGVPLVGSTVHGFYWHEGSSRARRAIFRTLDQVAAYHADFVLMQSREDFERARAEQIIPESRLAFLGNGIDLTSFDGERWLRREERARARRALMLDPDDLVVGIVGRIVREKGYEELADAAAALRPKFPGLKVVAAGPANEGKNDALRPVDIEMRSCGTFRALGFVSDMPRFYAALDVMTLPSWREGLPRSLIEAACMGVPTVATSIRGCREVVKHGETGLLVPPRNAGALAFALESLLADADRRRQMGAEARRWALAEFDEGKIVSTVLRVYDRGPLASTKRGTVRHRETSCTRSDGGGFEA